MRQRWSAGLEDLPALVGLAALWPQTGDGVDETPRGPMLGVCLNVFVFKKSDVIMLVN